MLKVNLFIVGAARSGTTSLWRTLKQHAEVFMPGSFFFKEPAYFSDLKRNMSKREYHRLFQVATYEHRIIGEASTAYLTDVSAAENIYRYNPGAKIVVLLRNPADRAYSLYNWMVQEGYEHCGSFEKALAVEPRRMRKKIPNFFEPEYYWNYMYFHSGCYAKQVERYMQRFKDGVHIIEFSKFIANTQAELDRLSNFLGLEGIQAEPRKANPSLHVNSPKFQFICRKLVDAITVFKRRYLHVSSSTKSKRDRLLGLTQKTNARSAISDNTRSKLLERYVPDIEELSRITGMDFSGWL